VPHFRRENDVPRNDMPRIIVRSDQSAGAPAPVALGERVVAADLRGDHYATQLRLLDWIDVEHDSQRSSEVRYVDRTYGETRAAIQAAMDRVASRQQFAIFSPRSTAMQSMSTLDSLFLHVENEVSQMHLGAVALFDGPAPSEGELAELVAGRLALLARYRQRVRLVPGGLGRPVWVEDPHFRLGYHLRHTALPSPGGAAQLRQLVGRVMAQPLDRERPLWEMWLFEGADAERWGLICKLHHCMVDGIAAGDLLGVLLSPEPGTAPSVPDDWQPRPEPSSASVLAHTLGKYASGASQHVRTARALLGAPGHTARRAATLTGGLISLAGAPTARSLNGPLRAERQWVQARARRGAWVSNS
jgi:hypothetical protein